MYRIGGQVYKVVDIDKEERGGDNRSLRNSALVWKEEDDIPTLILRSERKLSIFYRYHGFCSNEIKSIIPPKTLFE